MVWFMMIQLMSNVMNYSISMRKVKERDKLVDVDVDVIPDLDLYRSAEVLLPQNGEHMQAACVIIAVQKMMMAM